MRFSCLWIRCHMTCSWNRYIGCFTAPGWEPGISLHLCAFCLSATKTGKLITLWAHLHAGTAVSVQEGQMCKHRLLRAFSNHIAACHTSRKLVTSKSCKVMLLRNPFSNPDLRPVAPEPVRTTEAAFMAWARVSTACFTSERIEEHVWFVMFTAKGHLQVQVKATKA